jgi:hypothetical protein
VTYKTCLQWQQLNIDTQLNLKTFSVKGVNFADSQLRFDGVNLEQLDLVNPPHIHDASLTIG